jgi:hypothetical protein
MDSKIFISPYSQSLFDIGVQDSRVYLSRQVNSILQVFGSNVKISGLNIIINNDAKLINNKIASFTISPGKCIIDTTLHLFPTATTLELDVSSYDPSGYLVVLVSYNYTETLQQNRPIFKLLYVTHDGLDQLPDAWSPNKDNLILGVFKFNNHSPYNIELSHDNTILINGNVYTINPISDTIGYQHYLGSSDSEPDCNRCLLIDGDLYFDLIQKELFVYNGWSPIEDTFESDDNYNSGIILYTLKVIKSGAGIGTVISNPNGIDCGSTCSYQFAYGTNITLTATPDSSSVFSGWSGNATGTNTTTTVTMDSDKTVHAEFDLVYYNLTVTKSGTGTGTVTSNPSGINCGNTCTYQFVSGTNVTLTAIPDGLPFSSFSGWSGDATGTNSTVTITMSSNKNVTATFDIVYDLSVMNIGSGTGTVTSSPPGINCGSTCGYQFISGTSVTLTAIPNSGSVFSGWSGDVTGSNTTITFTMSANKSVFVAFNIAYTLTVTKSGTGTGTVTSNPSGINCGATCSYQFVSGINVTLTATPDSSSAFSGWSGDATGSSSTVTVTMNSNKSVTAIFNVYGEAGYFASGRSSTVYYSLIDKLLFSNESRTTLTAILSQTMFSQSACNSTLAGYFAGGYNGSSSQRVIDKLLFSNESRTTLTATLSHTISNQSACNSTLAGYFAGGGWLYSYIDKLLFSDESRSTLTATLSQSIDCQSACNSPLAGYFAGGYNGNNRSFIDKLLFSDESRSTLTATLSQSIQSQSACNSTLSGYFAGGYTFSYQNYIYKLSFSNESQSTLAATLSQSIDCQSACNSTLSGYFAGGYTFNNNNNNGNMSYSFIDKLSFNNESRTTLTATLSQSMYNQSACQSGGIL